MSKKATNKNNETNLNSITGTLKTENYMTSLQNENNILNSEIRKLNDVVIKLKSQLTNYETEKKNLILNSNKKESDLKEVKKKLTQTKKEVEELKQKMDISLINQTKNVEELKSKNDILQKYKNENQSLLVQLQKKITDLEFQLKAKESQKNFFKSPLKNDKNIVLSISPFSKKPKDNHANIIPHIINDDDTIKNLIDKNNYIQGNNELFLTGKNELVEMKEVNQRLNNELYELKKEMNLNKEEKSKLNEQLLKLQEEHRDLLNLLKNKNQEINNKLNQQNQLSNDLMTQLNKNQQMRKHFENIKIKYSNLEKSKKELEDVILLQENKVNELAINVQEVSSLVKIKDKEIKDNKSYINNLEKTIKDLNTEFKIMRNKKNKETQKKINMLKLQINNLKREYENKNNSSLNINMNFNDGPIHYRNNDLLNYGVNKRKYLTLVENDQSRRSLKTINNSSKIINRKAKNTPLVLTKISKIKDIPIGNSKKVLKKKSSGVTPFRHIPNTIKKSNLGAKKRNYTVNKLAKDNIYYNKSFKNLKEVNNNLYNNINIVNENNDKNNDANDNNYVNNNNYINVNNKDNEEKLKNDFGNSGPIIENGMSQSEINGSLDLYKINLVEDKEKDKINTLINSQIEKRDKEVVDNFKSFLNKLIDDLDS